jgi:serine/threonine-protein kinase
MSFQVGDKIGDYQIIGILGAGGMGRVYKVKNLISDRIDAMKVLLPDLAHEPELAERFLREIKVLASLNQPNIAGLRTAFRLENQLLMIMEFVDGVTLEDKLKGGPLSLQEATDYASQVLSALSYAHSLGVIHRDIKPANMMLTPANVIKLMDFGIAKSKTDRELTVAGNTVGSLYYMPPEQVRGAGLDGRSDLYSVGVSLYEMVTGSRPFAGPSDFDLMAAQLQQAPVPPIDVQPRLPRMLNDIIMIALEKDPAKRFQSAEAFRFALQNVRGEVTALPVASGQAFAPASPGQPAPSGGAPSSTHVMGSPLSLATGTQLQPSTPSQTAVPLAQLPATPSQTIVPPAQLPATPSQTIVPPAQPPATPPQTAVPAAQAPATPFQAAVPPAQPPVTPSQITVPPAQPPVSPPATSPKGYRGLYMTLGALVAVVVIVLAATQVPHLFKTKAGGAGQAVQPAASATTSTSPTPAQPVNAGANQQQSPSSASEPAPPSPATASQSGTLTGQPGQAPQQLEGSSNPPAQTPAPGRSKKRLVHGSQVGAASAGQADMAGERAGQAAAEAAKELEELGDRMTLLVGRGNAVRESVENLSRRQASSGYSLRPDISASAGRLDQYMGKADAALNARDPEGAKKYMDLAEQEIDNLEKFFGR